MHESSCGLSSTEAARAGGTIDVDQSPVRPGPANGLKCVGSMGSELVSNGIISTINHSLIVLRLQSSFKYQTRKTNIHQNLLNMVGITS